MKIGIVDILFCLLSFSTIAQSQKISRNDSVSSSQVGATQIGYSWIPKSTTTSAVSSLRPDSVTGVSLNPLLLLQGNSSGILVSRVDGQIGNSLRTLIRGNGSISLSSDPLIVLNGQALNTFPTSAASSNVGFGTRSNFDPMRFLNERDITSIHILKDISASTIYGSRGSNGVIIIETSEDVQKRSFNYYSSISFSTTSKRYDLLDRDTFLEAFGSFGGDVEFVDYGNNVDWQEEIFQSATSYNQYFSFANPYKNGYLSGSLGYEQVTGVIKDTHGNSLTASINNSHSFLNGRLKIDTRLIGSSLQEETPPISSNAGARGDLISSAYVGNPTWSTSPDSLQIGGGLINPSNLRAYYEDKTRTDRFMLSFRPSLLLTKTTKLDLRLGMDWLRSDRTIVVSSNSNNLTRGVPGNGRGALNDIEHDDRLLELILSDSRQLGESEIDFFIAYSDQQLERKTRDAEAWGFRNTDVSQMSEELRSYADHLESIIPDDYQQFGVSNNLRNAINDQGFFVNYLSPFTTEFLDPQGSANIQSLFANVDRVKTRLKSYTGRFLYSNRDKYFVNISSRIDNTNLYPKSQLSGSLSLAWDISKESFFGNKMPYLKLKAGYGEAGNLGFDVISQFNVDGKKEKFYPVVGVATDGSIAVPSALTLVTPTNTLKPEKTKEYSLGVEFAFDALGIKGGLNTYRRTTSNLVVISSNQFFRPFPMNVSGEVLNTGFEIDLSHGFTKGEFRLVTGANFSWNKNSINQFDDLLQFGSLFGPGLTSTFVQAVAEGEELFSYFLREFQGFDAAGLQNFGALGFVGKRSVANAFGGLDFDLSYRKWSLRLNFYGQFGHHLYNNTANAHFVRGAIASARNVPVSVLSSSESVSSTTTPSSRFLENGSFVRCQAVTLGYTPKMKTSSVLDQFQAFLILQNPFIWTGYSGLDPEVNIQTFGADYLAYPMHKTITVGISTSF